MTNSRNRLRSVEVLTLSPEDLAAAGYDITGLTQAEFDQLAESFGTALMDNDGWSTLDIVLEMSGVPRSEPDV